MAVKSYRALFIIKSKEPLLAEQISNYEIHHLISKDGLIIPFHSNEALLMNVDGHLAIEFCLFNIDETRCQELNHIGEFDFESILTDGFKSVSFFVKDINQQDITNLFDAVNLLILTFNGTKNVATKEFKLPSQK